MTEYINEIDFPHRMSLKLSLTSHHSSILLKLQDRLHASNPSEALRRLLELKSKQLLIRINPEILREIESLLGISVVREIIDGETFDDFVQWSLNQAIPILFDLIGTLEDPKVRLSLNQEQLIVASHLWRLSVLSEYKNGVSVQELAEFVRKPVQEVKEILFDLEMLGLVEKVKIISGGDVTWLAILNR